MVTIEQVAEAAVNRDSLRLRSLAQDLLAENPDLSAILRPRTRDPVLLSAAAGLIELLASRRNLDPPEWTQHVGPAPEPVYLLSAAATMNRLRALCESESPEPLRKRGFYA